MESVVVSELDMLLANLRMSSPIVTFLAVKVLVPIVIIAAGMVLTKAFMRLTDTSMQKAKVDELLRLFTVKIIKMLCLVLIVMTVLAVLGVPTTSFIAVIGSVGIATALAWRDVLANFAGGVLLLINRPFDKGDYIDDLQVKGTVERVDLFFSTLRSDEGQTVIIPNNRLANTTIINHHQKKDTQS